MSGRERKRPYSTNKISKFNPQKLHIKNSMKKQAILSAGCVYSGPICGLSAEYTLAEKFISKISAGTI